MSENIDEIIGPGGYPGEYRFVVPTAGDDRISLLTGMYSVDTDKIDWRGQPKIMKMLSVEDGKKTWLPSFVENPGIGSIYPEIGKSGDWYWISMPVKKDEKGVFIPDSTNVQVFKKSDYLSALESINMLDGLKKE